MVSGIREVSKLLDPAIMNMLMSTAEIPSGFGALFTLRNFARLAPGQPVYDRLDRIEREPMAASRDAGTVFPRCSAALWESATGAPLSLSSWPGLSCRHRPGIRIAGNLYLNNRTH